MSMIAAISSPSQNVLELGPLTIHFYGILIAIGVIVAIVVSKKRYERFGGSGEFFESAAIWAIVLGFLGARAGYVITHTHRFEGRPWAVLFLWEGGLALYGGLLVGALTVIYLVNKRGGDAFAFADAAAVGIPLAQAIGRWGNYFNQELFGTPSDLPWAIIIHPGHRPAGYEQFETFHPTFLYDPRSSTSPSGMRSSLCLSFSGSKGERSSQRVPPLVCTSSCTVSSDSRWSCCVPTPPSDSSE